MREEHPKAIRMEKSEKRIWKLSTSREKSADEQGEADTEQPPAG